MIRRAARGRYQSMAVTWLAVLYARLWRARLTFDDEFDVIVASGMRGGFARGGTTIGGVYLTGSSTSRAVLRHESVHADQWARYGFSFAARYLVEELRRGGVRNRFEIEAGLRDGGYER